MGVTELSRRIAATAATRLGLTPSFAHLDSTSFHVAGLSNSDEEPEAKVVHLTRGESREPRPDFNQVMSELLVEHQVGIPLLRKPRSGNSSDAHDLSEVIGAQGPQGHTTYGMSSLVAERAG